MKKITLLTLLGLTINLSAQTNQELTDINQLPIFPGCEMLIDKFEQLNCTNSQFVQLIQNNIKYPRQAQEMGCLGIVEISFIIRSNGTMTDITIVKDNTDGCGLKEEALRVVKSIAESTLRWTPGFSNGVETSVKMIVPIRFDEY